MTKRKINILTGGEHECCGVLCPRQEVQSHIDRMQRAIDAVSEYLNYGAYSNEMFEELVKELKELSSH